MILLSIVVPSYNAEKYLRKNLESLVPGGDEVEIIVVNDGSKDNTLAIAREFEEKYSNVHVIDQPNKGHGGGVNAGVAYAHGLYFKCVDADDWLDEETYPRFLSLLRENVEKGIEPDLYLADYYFDRFDEGKKHAMHTTKAYIKNRMFGWDEIPNLKMWEYLMMHSLFFKTSVIRESKMQLPEHTFYVDNLYCYYPLPFVKTFYAVDYQIYHYYVGRAEQSVNITSMDKNFMHEMRVIRAQTALYSFDFINSLPKAQKKYILHDFIAKSELAIFYAAIGNKDEKYQEYKKYLEEFEASDPQLLKYIKRHSAVGWLLSLPKFFRNWFVYSCYRAYSKVLGWY